MSEVRFCSPSCYDELGVKALYDKVKSRPGMAELLPDKFPLGRQCDKSYLYNCWNTLYPQEVKAVIDHANSQRYSVDNDKVKENSIMLSSHWKDELESQPFISRKRGKMSALLKQKSKIGVISKPRKKYEALDFLKRPRNQDTSLSLSQLQPQANQTRDSGSTQTKKITPTII